jgi:hypothetical protein
MIGRNQQRFDVAFGMAIYQRDAAGELADFGEELTRPLVDDRCDMAEPVALGDRDMARQHHEHARSRLAGFEQPLAILVASEIAEPSHARDFLRRQRREGLLMAREGVSRGSATLRPVFRRAVLTHHRLSSSREKQHRRHAKRVFRAKRRSTGAFLPASGRRYSPGFFPPASSREASACSEGEAVRPSRPLACDFRRLRFSRNACFRRSCRESFTAAPLSLARLSLRSFIAALSKPFVVPARIDRSSSPMHWSSLAQWTLHELVHQEAGKIIQFEAMSRPRMARWPRRSGTGSARSVDPIKDRLRGGGCGFWSLWRPGGDPARVLAPEGPLWQEPPA